MKLKPDPLGYPRHPLLVYFICFCIVAGLILLLRHPDPNSAEARLDPRLVFAWGSLVLLGSTASLVGMFWQGDERTGLVTKWWGYRVLTVASALYTLVLAGPGHDLFSATLTGTFSLACWLAARQVAKRIRVIRKVST